MQKSLTIALAAAGLWAASQVSFANALAPSPGTQPGATGKQPDSARENGRGRWWWLRARRRRNGPRRRRPKLRVRRTQPDDGTRTSDGTGPVMGRRASDGTRASNGTWQSVCASFPPWPFPRGAVPRFRPGLRLSRLVRRWKLLLELPVGRPRAKLLPGLRLGILRIDA